MYASAISLPPNSSSPFRPSAARAAVVRDPKSHGISQGALLGSLHKKTAGETLFTEGDELDSVYEVVRGLVRLSKLLPDGRRQITGFLTAGRLLGIAPDGLCVYTAEAITDVTLCRYRRSTFERLVDEAPGFARRLLTAASHELRAAQDQMLLLGRKTATEKVASFLIWTADQGDPAADEVDMPMIQSDIADYLGLTLETVCRTLRKLKQDGVIALPRRGRIQIRNRGRLDELAEGSAATDF
jgi:CRP/FNR family transcriptional regulator